jgi:hypothetical protein
VLLQATPHPVFKLAIMFGQFPDDGVRASREISVTGWFEKNGLADLEFVYRHGTPPRKQTTIVIYKIDAMNRKA